MMEVIAAGYIASVAANLTSHIFKGVSSSIRRKIGTAESREAFNNCVNPAVVATLSRVSKDLPKDDVTHLQAIYESFFDNPDVGRELACILNGNKINMKELGFLFEDAGYDSKTLPGVPFEQAVMEFQGALIEAIDHEPLLQPIIQIKVLKKQCNLQEGMLIEMRKLVELVKKANNKNLFISAGQIIEQNVDGGERRLIYDPNPPQKHLENRYEHIYLKLVISKCGHLDLSAIEENSLQCTVEDKDVLIKISDVFTTLFLKGVSRHPKQSVEDLLLKRDQKSDYKESEIKKDEYVPIQAIEAAGAIDHLVILGRPGGGKSTLSNHLVTTLAHILLGETGRIEKLPGWSIEDVKVPVRIVLREFATWVSEESKTNTNGLVWNYLRHLLETWGCEQYFNTLHLKLYETGGVIVFDGLDEVREDDENKKRIIIVRAIKDFARSMDKCRIIITCREYAYQRLRLDGVRSVGWGV